MGDMWGEMAAAWKEDTYKKQAETAKQPSRGRRNFQFRGGRGGSNHRGRGRGNFRSRGGNFRRSGPHQNHDQVDFGDSELAIKTFKNVTGGEDGEIEEDESRVETEVGRRDFSRGGHGRGGQFGGKGNPFRQAPKPIVAYCEMCDKEFKDMGKYEQHVSEHTQCPAKGCLYTAHFMLMETHFNMVHMSKLPGVDKAWELDTPEKIAEWRAERRKRFPKGEVVQKARAERYKKMENHNERKRKYEEAEMLKAASAQMKMIEDQPTPARTVRLSDASGVRHRSEAGEILDADPALGAYLNPVKQEAFDGPYPNQPDYSRNHFGGAPASIESNSKPEKKLFIPERFINDEPEALSMWPPPSSRKSQHAYSTKPSLIQRLLEQEIWRERTILIQCIEHTVKNNFYASSEAKQQPATPDT